MWWATSVLGTLARTDDLGVTSIVRALGLDDDRSYESLLQVFRSDAADVGELWGRWVRVVGSLADLVEVNGRLLLPSDGCKVVKEGALMPGVKRMHQESGDSSKPEYAFGHLFGCVGALARAEGGGTFCLPLCLDIQDGLRALAGWEGSPFSGESHVVQSLRRAWAAAEILGPAYMLADRYFLAATLLEALRELNATRGGEPLLELVTRARSNCVAYEESPGREPGTRGRPRKRGRAVALAPLFSDGAAFEAGEVELGGERVAAEWCVRDLLWGKGLYEPMRFVLLRCRGYETILATTDRSLSARQVAEAYFMRFGIECAFRSMKQDVSGFAYRFWTKACPELDRFSRSGDPDPLLGVDGPRERERVMSCALAIHRFVQVCAVAVGIAMLLACRHRVGGALDSALYRRRGGRAPAKVSERTVLECARRGALAWVFSRIGEGPGARMAAFIRSHTPGGRQKRPARR